MVRLFDRLKRLITGNHSPADEHAIKSDLILSEKRQSEMQTERNSAFRPSLSSGIAPKSAKSGATPLFIEKEKRNQVLPYPPLMDTKVPTALHVPCKIYWPTWESLDPQQRSFYLYFRSEARKHNFLECDTTYRFLYVYEIGARLQKMSNIISVWTRLYNAYPDDKIFRTHLGRWILDLHFVSGIYQLDSALSLLKQDEDIIDLAMLADQSIPSLALASLYGSGSIDLDQLSKILDWTRSQSEDPIEAFRRSCSSGLRKMDPLKGMGPARNYILSDLSFTTISYMANPKIPDYLERFVKSAESVVTGVGADLNPIIEPVRESKVSPIDSVTTSGNEIRTLIVRPFEPKKSIDIHIPEIPPPLTLNGLLFSIRFSWNPDVLVLLTTVIGLSIRYPFIDGRIDFSKILRDPFEGMSKYFRLKGTLGTMRQSYFTLSSGTRAIWQIEPIISESSEIKMGTTIARFHKPLQHALIGTNDRRAILSALVTSLESEQFPRKSIIDIIAEYTSADSSILPL